MRLAGEAAKQFWQAAQFLAGRRLKHRGEHACRMGGEAITSEAKRNDGVVVRPDGTVAIGNRIVAQLIYCNCSNSPPGEEISADAIRTARSATAIPVTSLDGGGT
jgi:hypothetical protein